MEAISSVIGTMMPLERDDVDTDQIMPRQFLTRLDRTGYGELVFHDWRREPDFVLEDRRFSGASVLVAGRNFGSGSSREHAVWGLQQFGFQALVAPSFSDIFLSNCVQNGLLPCIVSAETCRELQNQARSQPATEVRIDLAGCTVSWLEQSQRFDIDPLSREVLMSGRADLDVILEQLGAIDAYELGRPSWTPTIPAGAHTQPAPGQLIISGLQIPARGAADPKNQLNGARRPASGSKDHADLDDNRSDRGTR